MNVFDATDAPLADLVSFEPIGELSPGERFQIRVPDVRGGSVLGRPGESVRLPPPPGIPFGLVGPIAITGAQPGDAVTVKIEWIECARVGYIGAKAEYPLPQGRVKEGFARTCEVTSSSVVFSPGITFPLRPMVGIVGTTPLGEESPINPGRHGGNMDQSVIGAGATVFLPVHRNRALLWIGDIHAAMGDGELSDVGLEVAARVSLCVDLIPNAHLDWPWVTFDSRIAVLVAAMDFETARGFALEAAVSALHRQLGLSAGEAVGLISAAADLRIGQASGGPTPTTLRLELPSSLGLQLLPRRRKPVSSKRAVRIPATPTSARKTLRGRQPLLPPRTQGGCDRAQ